MEAQALAKRVKEVREKQKKAYKTSIIKVINSMEETGELEVDIDISDFNLSIISTVIDELKDSGYKCSISYLNEEDSQTVTLTVSIRHLV